MPVKLQLHVKNYRAEFDMVSELKDVRMEENDASGNPQYQEIYAVTVYPPYADRFHNMNVVTAMNILLKEYDSEITLKLLK